MFLGKTKFSGIDTNNNSKIQNSKYKCPLDQEWQIFEFAWLRDLVHFLQSFNFIWITKNEQDSSAMQIRIRLIRQFLSVIGINARKFRFPQEHKQIQLFITLF